MEIDKTFAIDFRVTKKITTNGHSIELMATEAKHVGVVYLIAVGRVDTVNQVVNAYLNQEVVEKFQ